MFRLTLKVTVWAKPSELVHVTAAPGATMMAFGLNAMFFIATAVVATGAAPPVPPVFVPPVVPGAVLSEPPPQASSAATGRIMRRERIRRYSRELSLRVSLRRARGHAAHGG